MTWGASDTPSLGSVFKGAADQQVTLALRSGGLRSRLGVMGEGHPVDPALRRQRLVARHPRPEIHEHHHAARRGLCLSVHGAFVAQGEASVMRTANQNSRRTSQ